MAVIKSENTKGNPYHESSDGEFTSKEAASKAMGKKDGIVPSTSSKEKSDTGFSGGLDGFWGSIFSTGEIAESEDKDDLMGVLIKPQDTLSVEKIEKLTYDETYETLIADPTIDSDKIYGLSESQAKELLSAQVIVNEAAKDNTLEDANSQLFYNIWAYPVKPSDYIDKKDKISLKEDFYNNSFKGTEEQKQEMLANLQAFVEAGEKYEQVKAEFDKKYSKAQDLVAQYQSDAYSEDRKDSAVWIGNEGSGVDVSKLSQHEITAITIKHFGAESQKLIDKIKSKGMNLYNALYNYTDSYHLVNEPLAGKTYYVGNKGGKKEFLEQVAALTNALDLCIYNEDIWTQHGTVSLNLGQYGTIDQYSTNADLAKIVGKEFQYTSFYSAGGAKGTGFSDKPVIVNAYCPSGTKMLHVASFSAFDYENEFIMQRGYTMRITKAYKGLDHNGSKKIFIDVEVLLGTDEAKYNNEKLQEIANNNIT